VTGRALWITDPAAYRDRLFGLVGPRDPLDVLSETADRLAGIAREHGPGRMRARTLPGRWTANEVLGHLVDSEWVYGFRIRYVYCESDPAIIGVDQDAWVHRQRHNDRDPMDLVETFRPMRRATLELWQRMSADDLARRGRHNERGPEALGTMVRMMAGHDLSHLEQIRRTLAAAGAA
jgi:hypothetical protein